MDLERSSHSASEGAVDGSVITVKDGRRSYRETTDMGYYERLDVNRRNLLARLAEGDGSRAKRDRRRFALGSIEAKMEGHYDF
jgi:hypothetical protein